MRIERTETKGNEKIICLSLVFESSLQITLYIISFDVQCKLKINVLKNDLYFGTKIKIKIAAKMR